MPIPARDRDLVHALRHAEQRTTTWRGHFPEARPLFARVLSSASALEAAAEAVEAERADDDPARSARDQAAARLRDSATQIVAHVRRKVHVDHTDAVGNVTDADRIAAVEGFLDEYTPRGGMSALGEGHTLSMHVRSLQAGLHRYHYGAQADALGPLLAAFDAANARVQAEVVELSGAYRKLELARAEAEAMRTAARAYTEYAAAWDPSLGIDVTAAFPAAPRSASPHAPPAPEPPADDASPTP